MGKPEHFPTNGTWGTRDELDFINRMGSFHGRHLGQRLDLLVSYREGLELRANWDGLDRAAVIRATEIAIGREIAKRLRRSLT